MISKNIRRLIPTFVCLACIFFVAPGGTYSAGKTDSNKKYLINFSCRIIDSNGVEVRRYPGDRCIFLSNGSFVTGDNEALSFYDANMSLVWQKKLHTHHQLKLTHDKEGILVMSSRIETFQGKKARFDVIHLFDLNGKKLKTFDFFEKFDGILKFAGENYQPKIKPSTPGFKKLFKIDHELTHANSIYEIPENPTGKKIRAFAKGNFIVNTNRPPMSFIVDAKMQSVLWAWNYDDRKKRVNTTSMMHDVQVLKDGKILFFENQSGSAMDHSTIRFLDPLTKKSTLLYAGTPKEQFASLDCCGSAQILNNGDILTVNNHGQAEILLIDGETKKIKRKIDGLLPAQNKKSGSGFIQEAFVEDLAEHLQKNMGL